MPETEIVRFKSAEALAQSAAESWLANLRVSESTSDPILVALSGGRIAARFFSALAGSADGILLRNLSVHFFWADERCVPPGHPESNFGMANELLIKPLGIPVAHVHRVPGEIEPDSAAADAETELRRRASVRATGTPVLDWVFLGMGEDGHIASLFPGEPESLRLSPALYRAVTSPKPPPNRVTLGYGALVAANNVWVLASGPGKERALRSSLSDQTDIPLAVLLRLRAKTRILTDVLPVVAD